MACKLDNDLAPDTMSTENNRNNQIDTTKNRSLGSPMKIRVSSSTFTAILLNNETATAFKTRLPMTIEMNELNGNEKFHRLPSNLPIKPANPGTIQTGDLMLYGSNTLVLFYKTFRTSYSYTKLGRIDDPSGLAAALGSGNVTVSFALE
ncbi:cyclophilin-like fold protein [Spirosoma telluris]